mmetsp:Transcript_87707/g.183363  ORF Transcript_87707/g.183363 Transcript_87707/m.183363 type:complete len:112 (+) Transcript_87707:627-962(+)
MDHQGHCGRFSRWNRQLHLQLTYWRLNFLRLDFCQNFNTIGLHRHGHKAASPRKLGKIANALDCKIEKKSPKLQKQTMLENRDKSTTGAAELCYAGDLKKPELSKAFLSWA